MTHIDWGGNTSGPWMDNGNTLGVLMTHIDWGAMLQAHGWIMAISWGVLIPLGAVIARNFKTLGPTWFNIHRVVQVIHVCAHRV